MGTITPHHIVSTSENGFALRAAAEMAYRRPTATDEEVFFAVNGAMRNYRRTISNRITREAANNARWLLDCARMADMPVSVMHAFYNAVRSKQSTLTSQETLKLPEPRVKMIMDALNHIPATYGKQNKRVACTLPQMCLMFHLGRLGISNKKTLDIFAHKMPSVALCDIRHELGRYYKIVRNSPHNWHWGQDGPFHALELKPPHA